MTALEAIIVAIVEGLTEFLPVSSTGHMIIASSLLGIEKGEYTKMFEVSIQFGAILAVVLVYWKKFLKFDEWTFYAKLLVGVIPALVLGFLFNDFIESLLESKVVVACTLLLGGIVLLYIDKWFKHAHTQPPDLLATEVTRAELIEADNKLSYKKSLAIGFWQVLAMVPGVSRSAASIIGGMQQGLSRNFAAEFSFFLAVPTMAAVCGYSLVLKDWGTGEAARKGYELIFQNSQTLQVFLLGNVVAFVVALLAIKFFIAYLKKYGFRVFGWYRIAVGVLLLLLLFLGYL